MYYSSAQINTEFYFPNYLKHYDLLEVWIIAMFRRVSVQIVYADQMIGNNSSNDGISLHNFSGRLPL